VTAAWPRADQRLERAYRRLLLAYPGRYRRRHGTEIVTTLLEMAGPDQHRPDRDEAWHLLASGLRQRFRLPAGRPVAWVAAVLIALIAGAFGAAAGSWAGELTFADLPAEATVARQAAGEIDTDQLAVLHDASPWSADMIFADSRLGPGWNPEHTEQRLSAAGWTVTPGAPLSGHAVTVDPATGAPVDVPVRGTELRAESHGVLLQVRGYVTAQTSSVSVTGWAARTPAYLPLVVLGTLLGLVAGWLLAAAGAYRLVRARRPWLAATVSATAILALVLPAVALYGNLMRVFRRLGDFGPAHTVHSAFSPGPYYPFGPTWQVLALSVAGVVLAAGALLVARPGGSAQPEQNPA